MANCKLTSVLDEKLSALREQVATFVVWRWCALHAIIVLGVSAFWSLCCTSSMRLRESSLVGLLWKPGPTPNAALSMAYVSWSNCAVAVYTWVLIRF